MTDTIIDSSAWIAYFRPGQNSISDRVEALIEHDASILVGPVLAELLQGVKGQRESMQLERVMAAIPYRDTNRQDWRSAGHNLQALRRQGVTVPLTDALIASMARRLDVPVLTLDQHFDHLDVARARIE